MRTLFFLNDGDGCWQLRNRFYKKKQELGGCHFERWLCKIIERESSMATGDLVGAGSGYSCMVHGSMGGTSDLRVGMLCI